MWNDRFRSRLDGSSKRLLMMRSRQRTGGRVRQAVDKVPRDGVSILWAGPSKRL